MALILWTDEFDPADVTGYARTAISSYASAAPLASVFPDGTVLDQFAEWTVNEIFNDVAQLRSYDAETPIGGGTGGEEKTAKLYPLGLKLRFGEYEQLRRMAQGSPESVQDALDKKSENVARAVIDRLTLLRAEALVTGALAINENKFVQNVDFGRAAALTNVAPTTLWTATGADPVENLEEWAALLSVKPDHIAMNAATFRLMATAIADSGYVTQSVGIVSREAVNGVLASYGLPEVEVISGSIAGQPILANGVVTMAVKGMTGATPWGVTVESTDPRYNLSPVDRPGLVVGTYREDDPDAKWVRSNAIALPLLTNPSTSLSAKVTA